MKMTVKSMVAAAAALVLGSAAFAEAKVSFYDKVSSDIVNFGNSTTKVVVAGTEQDPVKTTDEAEFAGIKNRVYAEVKSERVDAAIKADITFATMKNADNKDVGYIAPDFFTIPLDMSSIAVGLKDWYVEFRPVSFITLGFHDAIMADGSYLPVLDDNNASGNIGSDFVICVKPISALRLTAGLDLPVVFDSVDLNGDDRNPTINFGAIFSTDVFNIGAAFRDVANKDTFNCGAYASVTALEGLTANVAYTYNGGAVVSGSNAVALGVTSTGLVDGLTIKADFETNFKSNSDETAPFIYAGLNPEFQITDALDAGIACTGTFAAWEVSSVKNSANEFVVNPYVDYAIGKHSFGIGFSATISAESSKVDDNNYSNTTGVSFGFPVYYKYAF